MIAAAIVISALSDLAGVCACREEARQPENLLRPAPLAAAELPTSPALAVDEEVRGVAPPAADEPAQAPRSDKPTEPSPQPSAAKPRPQPSAAEPRIAPPAPVPVAPPPKPTAPLAQRAAPTKVIVPRTDHVRFDVPAGLQAWLDADDRMIRWLSKAIDIVDACYAGERADKPAAGGVITFDVTMHANARPSGSVGSVAGPIRGVVLCATSRLMSIKMPLFTGKEGDRYTVKAHFEP